MNVGQFARVEVRKAAHALSRVRVQVGMLSVHPPHAVFYIKKGERERLYYNKPDMS